MMHDRDQEVARLRAEGYRYRAIAKIQGMSLAGVQRALQRAEKVPLDLDDDNDALDPLHLDEEDDEPMWPLTPVGVDEYVDAAGQRLDALAAYRAQRFLVLRGRDQRRDGAEP